MVDFWKSEQWTEERNNDHEKEMYPSCPNADAARPLVWRAFNDEHAPG
jgi:hypothetical protein